jgi:hypothetical protein
LLLKQPIDGQEFSQNPYSGRAATTCASASRTAHAPMFTITFRAAPRGPDKYGREPVYRLKLLLKHALRALGLRAVSVEQASPSSWSPPPPAQIR